MPGGRCPASLEDSFLEDVQAGLSNGQLAEKYGRVKRTIRSWKTMLRRKGKLGDEPQQTTPRETVAFREIQNYASASCTSERIRTLDGLLEACEVDLGVWRVNDWGVKKWEVGAKIKYGDLAWEGGKATGWQQHKGLGVQDLWSVWAKFIRRELLPVELVVRPVECTARYTRPPAPKATGVRRSLVFADPQIGFSQEVTSAKLEPFHDRAVLDLLLQMAVHLQPDRIDILGDWFDFVMWTDRFLRSPKFEYTTQPAICEGHWWLRQFREGCPDAEIKIIEGNHDARMRKALMTHLRAAYGLKPADEMELPAALSPERLLALHRLGIEWIGHYPNGEVWLNDQLRLEHGAVARNQPGATARAVVDSTDASTLFGHCHRRERASRTLHLQTGPRDITAVSPGCACRVDGAVPGVKDRQNWQQGAAIVDYTDDDHSTALVEIRNGRAICGGEVYEARDRVGDLRADLPDWNW